MEKVKCNLCGESNFLLLHKIDVTEKNLKFYLYSRNIPNKKTMTGELAIVKCKNCGLVYANPRCTNRELKLLYSSNKHLGGNWRNWPYLFDLSQPDDLQVKKGYDAKYLNNVAKWRRWRVDFVERYRKKYLKTTVKNTQLLDVGCGYGAFLKAASDFGYDVYGCDLVKDRVSIAKKHYKLKNLKKGSPEKVFGGKKFNVITLWDVVEHLPDPKKLLISLNKMLKKNGLIFIYTMSLDSWSYRLFGKCWYYIDPIGHLYYFSDKTIRKLIETSGLYYLGKELDISRSTKPFYIIKAFKSGLENYIIFNAYQTSGFWQNIIKKVLKLFFKPIPEKKLKKRMENLCPYIFPIRYKDSFIYAGQKRK